jgi:hypothetical protein
VDWRKLGLTGPVPLFQRQGSREFGVCICVSASNGRRRQKVICKCNAAKIKENSCTDRLTWGTSDFYICLIHAGLYQLAVFLRSHHSLCTRLAFSFRCNSSVSCQPAVKVVPFFASTPTSSPRPLPSFGCFHLRYHNNSQHGPHGCPLCLQAMIPAPQSF